MQPSRRDALKFGLYAGGAVLLSSSPVAAQICTTVIDPPPPVSPPTTPFVSPLRRMPVLQPLSTPLDPPVDPSFHQRYSDFLPKKFYQIAIQEFQHVFHPELPPNTVWGYNGMIPGPTIKANYREPVLVRVHNQLDPNHTGWGMPSIVTHLHNLHTPSESDGFPANFTDAGRYWDHHYVNYYAGGDPSEQLSTLWYHDHRQDHTAENVTRGLTGFYLLFDERDSGNEKDTNPNAFRLPSGEYDVPVVLHDRAFDQSGTQIFPLFNTDGVIGDKYTLNNTIQPYMQVKPRKYRFRFLDGGPSRFYQLFLSDGYKFTQITEDGNLLPVPLQVDGVLLGVANRADVIIDFSQVPYGSSIYLVNRLEQTSGRGPTWKLMDPGDQMMRFDVVLPLDEPDQSQVPAKFFSLPKVDLSEVVRERTFKFDYFNGSWLINGQTFDENRVDAAPKQGTAEIWTLRNEGRGWSHPIHIHFEEFQIIERNGKPIPANSPEHSRKDVVILRELEEVKLFFRFRDFLGRYPMHCHNVVHEDHSMMLRWDIVP